MRQRSRVGCAPGSGEALPATGDPRDTLTVGFGVAAAVVLKVSDTVVVPPDQSRSRCRSMGSLPIDLRGHRPRTT
jgi:hypothetical protein